MTFVRFHLKRLLNGLPVLPDDAIQQSKIVMVKFDSPVHCRVLLAGIDALSKEVGINCEIITFSEDASLEYLENGTRIK